MCGHLHTPTKAKAWGSEDSFQESVFSFYHVGPRDQAQVIRFSSMLLYLLSCPASNTPFPLKCDIRSVFTYDDSVRKFPKVIFFSKVSPFYKRPGS